MAQQNKGFIARMLEGKERSEIIGCIELMVDVVESFGEHGIQIVVVLLQEGKQPTPRFAVKSAQHAVQLRLARPGDVFLRDILSAVDALVGHTADGESV